MTRIALTGDLHYGFNAYFHSAITDELCFASFVDVNDEIQRMLYEIREDKPDILIMTGDIISHNQHQWKEILGPIRKILPNMPILTVFGNHDFWATKRKWPFPKVLEYQRTMMDEYDIIYLPKCPYHDENITVVGFDGWYGQAHDSNDDQYIPYSIGELPLDDWFSQRAQEQLERIPVKSEGCTTVLVTHFDLLGNTEFSGPSFFLDDIANGKKADMVFMGHSHRQIIDKEVLGLRIFNAGSDYGNPHYLIIDV